jgi:hypothetical protein
LLGDGTVLIAGGFNGTAAWTLAAFGHGLGDTGSWTPTSGAIENTAEIFDPNGSSFTAVGTMSAARFGHTATLLTNNKVLIVGGFGGATTAAPGLPLNSAELYSPATLPSTGTFTATGSLKAARAWHSATLIQ